MTNDVDRSDGDGDPAGPSDAIDDETTPRGRLEESAERAVEGLDRGVVEVLDWLLETETRSRIYVHLRTAPDSTSEEIAEGTGLYPSTVREALAELHEEGIVSRDKRVNEGAGNNPYEYRAIPPSDLVGTMMTRVQDQLNRVLDLDAHLRPEEPTSSSDAITISVEDADAEDAEGAEEAADPDADAGETDGWETSPDDEEADGDHGTDQS